MPPRDSGSSLRTQPSVTTLRRKPISQRKQIRRPVKKSTVARVAATLRRRRSALRDRYEKAVIQLLERHERTPCHSQEGLLYHVRQVPDGHSRDSLIESFDAVVELLNIGGSGSSKLTVSATKAPEQARDSTISASASMNLLDDDIFGPDDFNRYIQEPVCPSPDRHGPEEVLIQFDLDSPTIPPTWSPPQNLTNSRPPSVDELLFGNTVRLSIRSLLSPPSSPREGSLAALGEFRMQDAATVSQPEICRSTVPSSTVDVTASALTPPLLSDSRPPSGDEMFFDRAVQVQVQQHIHLPTASPPRIPPLKVSVSIVESTWPKPLAFHAPPQPLSLRTNATIQSSRADTTNSNTRSLRRRPGGDDLHARASVKLTGTVPKPDASPASQKTLESSPYTHLIQRKPVKAALGSGDSPLMPLQPWRAYPTATPESSCSYRAYSPTAREVPSLPSIPRLSRVSLMDEMNEELDKLMSEWSSGSALQQDQRTPPPASLEYLEVSRDPSPVDHFGISRPCAEGHSAPVRRIHTPDTDTDLLSNVADLMIHSGQPGATSAEAVSAKSTSMPSAGAQPAASDLLDDLLTDLERLPPPPLKPTNSLPHVIKRRRSRADISSCPTSHRQRAPSIPERTSSRYPPPTQNIAIPAAITQQRCGVRYTPYAPPTKSLPPLPAAVYQPPEPVSPTKPHPPVPANNHQAALSFSSIYVATPTLASSSSAQLSPSTPNSSLPPSPSPSSNPSFRTQLTSATLAALLEASDEAEFNRAWSQVKNTKRESRGDLRRLGRREERMFGWRRWVDREWGDGRGIAGRDQPQTKGRERDPQPQPRANRCQDGDDDVVSNGDISARTHPGPADHGNIGGNSTTSVQRTRRSADHNHGFDHEQELTHTDERVHPFHPHHRLLSVPYSNGSHPQNRDGGQRHPSVTEEKEREDTKTIRRRSNLFEVLRDDEGC